MCVSLGRAERRGRAVTQNKASFVHGLENIYRRKMRDNVCTYAPANDFESLSLSYSPPLFPFLPLLVLLPSSDSIHTYLYVSYIMIII